MKQNSFIILKKNEKNKINERNNTLNFQMKSLNQKINNLSN